MTVLWRFAMLRGTAPLIVDTINCGVDAAPLTVRIPVLIWRVERDVVITSPISKKALLNPSWRASTVREEI
jgi:hypothetical protein